MRLLLGTEEAFAKSVPRMQNAEVETEMKTVTLTEQEAKSIRLYIRHGLLAIDEQIKKIKASRAEMTASGNIDIAAGFSSIAQECKWERWRKQETKLLNKFLKRPIKIQP